MLFLNAVSNISNSAVNINLCSYRCTINPGENEALVRYALDKYKFLSLASQVRSSICINSLVYYNYGLRLSYFLLTRVTI